MISRASTACCNAYFIYFASAFQIRSMPHHLLTAPIPSGASQVSQWVKESTCSTGDAGLIPSLGRSPGEQHGNSGQSSWLENPRDRGAWRATVQALQRV